MIAREYIHKEYICNCSPNHAVGDPEGANHKDPRNEWTHQTFTLSKGFCIYCEKPMRANPRVGEVEIIKNGKFGSWQNNTPEN